MIKINKKKYFFMTYAEWFFIDKDWEIKLTNAGKAVPKCVNSYKRYLKDTKNEEDE